jgi:hypothetical protein
MAVLPVPGFPARRMARPPIYMMQHIHMEEVKERLLCIIT